MTVRRRVQNGTTSRSGWKHRTTRICFLWSISPTSGSTGLLSFLPPQACCSSRRSPISTKTIFLIQRGNKTERPTGNGNPFKGAQNPISLQVLLGKLHVGHSVSRLRFTGGSGALRWPWHPHTFNLHGPGKRVSYFFHEKNIYLPMLSDILRILFGQSYKIDTRRSWRKKGDHFSRIGFNL